MFTTTSVALFYLAGLVLLLVEDANATAPHAGPPGHGDRPH